MKEIKIMALLTCLWLGWVGTAHSDVNEKIIASKNACWMGRVWVADHVDNNKNLIVAERLFADNSMPYSQRLYFFNFGVGSMVPKEKRLDYISDSLTKIWDLEKATTQEKDNLTLQAIGEIAMMKNGRSSQAKVDWLYARLEERVKNINFKVWVPWVATDGVDENIFIKNRRYASFGVWDATYSAYQYIRYGEDEDFNAFNAVVLSVIGAASEDFEKKEERIFAIWEKALDYNNDPQKEEILQEAKQFTRRAVMRWVIQLYNVKKQQDVDTLSLF